MQSIIESVLSYYAARYVEDDARLSVSLGASGHAELRDVTLRTDTLSELLGDAQLPVRVTRARAQLLRIHVPWTALGSSPVLVDLRHVDVELEPLADTSSDGSGASTASSDSSGDSGRAEFSSDLSGAGAGSNRSATANNAGRSNDGSNSNGNDSDSNSRRGSNDTNRDGRVAADVEGNGWTSGLVRKLINNVSVRLSDVALKYVDGDVRLAIFCRNLQLNSASRVDWSPAYVAPGHANLMQKALAVSGVTVTLERVPQQRRVVRRRRRAPVPEPPIIERFGFEARMQRVGTRRVAIALDVRVPAVALALSIEQHDLLHALLGRALDRARHRRGCRSSVPSSARATTTSAADAHSTTAVDAAGRIPPNDSHDNNHIQHTNKKDIRDNANNNSANGSDSSGSRANDDASAASKTNALSWSAWVLGAVMPSPAEPSTPTLRSPAAPPANSTSSKEPISLSGNLFIERASISIFDRDSAVRSHATNSSHDATDENDDSADAAAALAAAERAHDLPPIFVEQHFRNSQLLRNDDANIARRNASADRESGATSDVQHDASRPGRRRLVHVQLSGAALRYQSLRSGVRRALMALDTVRVCSDATSSDSATDIEPNAPSLPCVLLDDQHEPVDENPAPRAFYSRSLFGASCAV